MRGGIDVTAVAQGGNKFCAICCAGDMVYAAPMRADVLLEFDPASGAARGIDVSAVAQGDYKFVGICCAGDKVYAAPYCCADVLLGPDVLLEFDPASGAVRGIDVSAVAQGNFKFSGICCAGGKVYAAPCHADVLLEFDPASGAVRGIDVSAVAQGDDKFSGICCAGDKLYAAPHCADVLLEFDPASGAVRGIDVSAVAQGDFKFDGICCAGDKVYAAPCHADVLLEFDPASGAVRGIDVSAVAQGNFKFSGICCAGDRVYAAPCCADVLMEFEMFPTLLLQASLDGRSICFVTLGGMERCRIGAAPAASLAGVRDQLAGEHRASRLGAGFGRVDAVLPDGRFLSVAPVDATVAGAFGPAPRS